MRKWIAGLCIALLVQSTAYASDLSEWAETDYESAARAGLLSYNVTEKTLNRNITREEFCDLVINLFKNLSEKEVYTPEIFPFEDSDSIAVARAYALGIVSGRTEDSFDPEGTVTREEIAKILVNTLKSAEVNLITLRSEAEELLQPFEDRETISLWAMNELITALKYSIISGMSETQIAPQDGATREQAIAMVNRVYTQFTQEKTTYDAPEFLNIADGLTVDDNLSLEMNKIDGAKKYIAIIKDTDAKLVRTIESDTPKLKADLSIFNDNTKYTFTAGFRYDSGLEIYALPIDVVYKASPKIITIVNNDKATLYAKNMRVFPGGVLFATQEEAEANMVNVTVNVWELDKNGEKVAAKKTLTVNQFLAEDVKKIFQEIFEDSSKFPIKSVGGYCWRNTAFGNVSQHSYGTCIDINPDENYYCYAADGAPITGTHWKPYEDPYSIVPDGAVVASFAKYGWTWGGNWDGTLKDYMHFTYLGK